MSLRSRIRASRCACVGASQECPPTDRTHAWPWPIRATPHHRHPSGVGANAWRILTNVVDTNNPLPVRKITPATTDICHARPARGASWACNKTPRSGGVERARPRVARYAEVPASGACCFCRLMPVLSSDAGRRDGRPPERNPVRPAPVGSGREAIATETRARGRTAEEAARLLWWSRATLYRHQEDHAARESATI